MHCTELPTFKKTLEWDFVGCVSHGETVRVGCIFDHLYRVDQTSSFPGHVLFSRPKKCVRQGFQKRPGFCLAGYLCFSGSFTNLLLRPYKFWKGYLLAELYYCDCVWPRSCIDGLVLVYSSPRVVRFAKQFPARTLGGLTLFVEDDLRDAFFVGVAVVVDCLFTFSQ